MAGALHLAGYDAGRALAALWRGSFGTTSSFVSATLVRSTPLLLAGLGVALAFRAGIWNIGAEGQLLAGAAAAAALGLIPTPVPRILLLPAVLGCWSARRRVLGFDRRVSPPPPRRARGDLHDHAQLRRAPCRWHPRAWPAPGAVRHLPTERFDRGRRAPAASASRERVSMWGLPSRSSSRPRCGGGFARPPPGSACEPSGRIPAPPLWPDASTCRASPAWRSSPAGHSRDWLALSKSVV